MMNINCIICSDLFGHSSIIYVTPCGHIFHYECLIQWFERSKTCPQCRAKTTENQIVRLYLNVISSDGIGDNAATLQNQLDGIKLQLRLKDQDLKSTKGKMDEITAKSTRLQNELGDALSDATKYKSAVVSLKDQLKLSRDRTKCMDKMERELKELKDLNERITNTMNAVTGSLEDANLIISNSNCPKTLADIAKSLKRELTKMHKKRNDLFSELKRTERDLHSSRKELNRLKEDNHHLKLDLNLHATCKTQMESLKRKLSDLTTTNSPKRCNCTITSSSSNVHRLVNESPAPLLLVQPKKRKLLNDHDGDVSFVDSPTISSRINDIKSADSPYLVTKSNNMQAFLGKRSATTTKYGNGHTSIFRTGAAAATSNSKSSSGIEMTYNGFGGHSRDEPFPVPSNLKRSKSSSSVGSCSKKLHKLSKPAFH